MRRASDREWSKSTTFVNLPTSEAPKHSTIGFSLIGLRAGQTKLLVAGANIIQMIKKGSEYHDTSTKCVLD